MSPRKRQPSQPPARRGEHFAEYRRYGIFSKFFGDECCTFIVPEAAIAPPGVSGVYLAVHVPITRDLSESRRLARALIDRMLETG